MTEFVTLELQNNESIGLSVEWNGKGYTYLQKLNNNITTIGINTKKPNELGEQTDIGKTIKKYINKLEISLIDNKPVDEKITRETSLKSLMNEEYNALMSKLMSVLKKNNLQEKQKQEKKQEEKQEHYQQLYNYYTERKKSYNYTDLEFIGQVSLGLGVGLQNTILKMFINHLLTVTQIRPSNQILYSLQASGKSFIIDQTLKMIPDEYIVGGRHTEASFFNEFAGKDVSGMIFNFGDLGGDNDNEDTLRVRDYIKVLNTDGYLERTKSGENKEPIKQVVTGKPSLTYSTVEKDIINSQEKSRGSVFSPPLIDEYQLAIFNTIKDSPGIFKDTLNLINKDVESIQSFVWFIKEDLKNYELFNPYIFNVTSFLRRMDDYNRKIDEFNKVLLIVTYLNNPFVLKHNLYDETTNLMIATKQDVINALSLFEGKDNLLPNYRLCIQHIFKEYKLRDTDLYTDAEDYNDWVVTLDEEYCFAYPKDNEDPFILKWDSEHGDSDVYFTISTIRKRFNGKDWFKRVKNNLSEVLKTLQEYGYLLKIEKYKLGRENIYCLPFDLEYQLNNIAPEWGGVEFKKGKEIFESSYPELYNDFKEFINNDIKKRINTSNLELDYCKIYDLIWENYHEYTVANDVVGEDNFVREGQNQEDEGSKPENLGSRPENIGSKPEKWGSKPDPKMWEEPSFSK